MKCECGALKGILGRVRFASLSISAVKWGNFDALVFAPFSCIISMYCIVFKKPNISICFILRVSCRYFVPSRLVLRGTGNLLALKLLVELDGIAKDTNVSLRYS